MWRGRRRRRGRLAGRTGDGSDDEGKTFGDVFGPWLAAFGQVHVDVVSGRGRAWSTGWWRFRGSDGVLEEGVIRGGEDVT